MTEKIEKEREREREKKRERQRGVSYYTTQHPDAFDGNFMQLALFLIASYKL